MNNLTFLSPGMENCSRKFVQNLDRCVRPKNLCLVPVSLSVPPYRDCDSDSGTSSAALHDLAMRPLRIGTTLPLEAGG